MTIDIPSKVMLVSDALREEETWGGTPFVCFRHAVTRALRGENISMRLETSDNDYEWRCRDCQGEP